MKFTVTFQAESVVQNNGPVIQTIPPSESPPPGVGISVSGRYVSLPGSEAQGFFTFNRTNSAVTPTGLLGTGVLIAHLTKDCDSMLITTTYTLELATPSVSIRHTSVITGALVNGKNYIGTVKVVTPDGGLTYSMRFRLRPAC